MYSPEFTVEAEVTINIANPDLRSEVKGLRTAQQITILLHQFLRALVRTEGNTAADNPYSETIQQVLRLLEIRDIYEVGQQDRNAMQQDRKPMLITFCDNDAALFFSQAGSLIIQLENQFQIQLRTNSDHHPVFQYSLMTTAYGSARTAVSAKSALELLQHLNDGALSVHETLSKQRTMGKFPGLTFITPNAELVPAGKVDLSNSLSLMATARGIPLSTLTAEYLTPLENTQMGIRLVISVASKTDFVWLVLGAGHQPKPFKFYSTPIHVQLTIFNQLGRVGLIRSRNDSFAALHSLVLGRAVHSKLQGEEGKLADKGLKQLMQQDSPSMGEIKLPHNATPTQHASPDQMAAFLDAWSEDEDMGDADTGIASGPQTAISRGHSTGRAATPQPIRRRAPHNPATCLRC